MQPSVNYEELHWTERRVVREKYVEQQEGKCCHCHGSLKSIPPKAITSKLIDIGLFPGNFFKYPVHLHHDRDTGMTIGAVHNLCNAVLWQYHGE